MNRNPPTGTTQNSKSNSLQSNTKIHDTISTEKKFAKYDTYICVPMTIDKKPIVSWKNIKETPRHLFKTEHNIALLTGKVNAITVIDIDLPKHNKNELDGMKLMKDLLHRYNNGKCLEVPTCRTQSGGLHLYFKYDADIKTSTGLNGYSIDVRNDNALIIAPPSVGEKGPYLWMDNLNLYNTELELIVIPKWLKEWLMMNEKKSLNGVEVKVGKLNATNTINRQDYQINKEYVYIYDKEKIIELLNKLPTKYLDTYINWFTVTSCLKSENLIDIWKNWSKNSKNYDEDNNIRQWNAFTPKLNINYLVVLAKCENIDVESTIIYMTKRVKFFNAIPDLQINKKYINTEDIVLTDDAIVKTDNMFVNSTIVRSPVGTGKTTFACGLINSLIKDNAYQLLSISVRVTLAFQQVSNFEKNNLMIGNYKKISDNNELNKQENLVIQVDSIIRINPNKWRNTIIYLDEISCLFSYILTSSTLDKKRMTVFNTLCDLLTQASKILVTDADVNDMVLMFFDKINIKYHLVENIYKNPINTPGIEYISKEILIRQIENQFLIDKPTIVCFDSKKEMNMTVERLKKYCEDNKLIKQLNNFMIYSSTEGDDNDFFHINDRWKNKYVFITPKVTIGVSFDNKIPRNVYLIGMGNSINSIAFVQQFSRCRNIKELHYYVANRYQPLKYKCVDDVRSYYKNIINDYNNLCCTNVNNNNATINTVNKDDELHLDRTDYEKLKIIIDTGNATKDFTKGNNWIINESIFNEMFFYNEYYDNILRSAPKEQFRWLIQDKGFDISFNNDVIIDDITKKEISKINKTSKERVAINDDRICQRALYNKLSSLTENEKKIYEDATRRAKYLNIDFTKKVQKKKWEKYLINDVEFTRHIAYRLLTDSENKLDVRISAILEKDYKITICNSLETKIKLIKKIEKILGVETLDIDTQRDMDRFDEKVIIDDGLLKLVKKTFRINKTNNKISDSFEHLYYELIQLYKHVLGNNICNFKLITIDNVHHRKYIINSKVLNEHINLSKL